MYNTVIYIYVYVYTTPFRKILTSLRLALSGSIPLAYEVQIRGVKQSPCRMVLRVPKTQTLPASWQGLPKARSVRPGMERSDMRCGDIYRYLKLSESVVKR